MNLKQELEKFLFNLYFEMYKEYPTSAREEFRKMFTQRHGEYKYINELMLALQNYQVAKFKQTLQF